MSEFISFTCFRLQLLSSVILNVYIRQDETSAYFSQTVCLRRLNYFFAFLTSAWHSLTQKVTVLNTYHEEKKKPENVDSLRKTCYCRIAYIGRQYIGGVWAILSSTPNLT